MYGILFIVFCTIHWTHQHLTYPVNYCNMASVCIHDNRQVCASTPDGCSRRTFIDQCDMYEYNCDYGSNFLQQLCHVPDKPKPLSHPETLKEVINVIDPVEPDEETTMYGDCNRPWTWETTVKDKLQHYSTSKQQQYQITTNNRPTTQSTTTYKETSRYDKVNLAGSTIEEIITTKTADQDHSGEPSTLGKPSEPENADQNRSDEQSTLDKQSNPDEKLNYNEKITQTTKHILITNKVRKTTKHCGDCLRPNTWATTKRGETRDFFRILKHQEYLD